MIIRQADHVQRPLQRTCWPTAESTNIVNMLLEKGANVDARDSDGRTPLSHIVETGHEAIVEMLLEEGANVNAEDITGRTPLLYIAEKGCEAIAKLLQRKSR